MTGGPAKGSPLRAPRSAVSARLSFVPPIDYAAHTPFTDPGRHAALLDAVPADVAGAAEVVRNLLYHYRADGIEVPEDRRADIDCRWVARTLDVDQARHPGSPLAAERARPDRVAGCCRDYTLLTVAALRQHGIPARSRPGFAGYFDAEYHFDHVVVEWWDGTRWVRSDAQLDPTRPGPLGPWPFDTLDLPAAGLAGFATAAEVWRALRAGEADPATFGVFPGSPFAGTAFVHDYVILELAHRQGAELLLWDGWGGMLAPDEVSDAAAGFIDTIAALLVAADAGDAAAEAELAERYASDDRLNPRGRVTQHSPYGTPDVVVELAG